MKEVFIDYFRVSHMSNKILNKFYSKTISFVTYELLFLGKSKRKR